VLHPVKAVTCPNAHRKSHSLSVRIREILRHLVELRRTVLDHFDFMGALCKRNGVGNEFVVLFFKLNLDVELLVCVDAVLTSRAVWDIVK